MAKSRHGQAKRDGTPRGFLLLSLTIASVAASGCGSDAPTQIETATNTSRFPLTSAGPATDSAVAPCTGIDGCHEVAAVDVDGDGKLDRVGITVVQQPPPPQVVYGEATIRVTIAVGDEVKHIDVKSPGVLPGDSVSPRPYVGAYRVSRKAGADLVLHTQLGHGNSEQFVVVGWRGMEPTLVDRPPSDANAQTTDVWYIGSSHGVHEWVTCSDGAAVTMNKLSAPTSEGIPLPGGGIHELDSFVFDGSSWMPNGSKNIADNNFSYDFDPHTQTFQCEDQAER